MLRVASAAVLAPVALVATYVGGWLFSRSARSRRGGILWEWTALVARTRRSAHSGAGLGRAVGGVVLPGFG